MFKNTDFYRTFMLNKIQYQAKKDKQEFNDLISSIPECNTQFEFNSTVPYFLNGYKNLLLDIEIIKNNLIEKNLLISDEDLAIFTEINDNYYKLYDFANLNIVQLEKEAFKMNILSLNLAVIFAINQINHKKIINEFRFLDVTLTKLIPFLKKQELSITKAV
jgi:hypothetical protein